MTKADLVSAMAKASGAARYRPSGRSGFFANVFDALKRGRRVTIGGFGTFMVSKRVARDGRGIRITLPVRAVAAVARDALADHEGAEAPMVTRRPSERVEDVREESPSARSGRYLAAPEALAMALTSRLWSWLLPLLDGRTGRQDAQSFDGREEAIGGEGLFEHGACTSSTNCQGEGLAVSPVMKTKRFASPG